MGTITAKVLSDFSDAFRADLWKVQIKNRLTEQAIRVNYTPEQLLKAMSFLRLKNRDGFDIYARPVGWQYVLLDDLTRGVLADLAELKPCALLETSPANYQAWLILPETPADRDAAMSVCRELAQQFKADPASADSDHVGRLPGYTNRKQKHQLLDGRYPYVRLHRSEHRLSTFYPCGAGVLKENESVRSACPASGHSESERDFGIACGLIRKGLTDHQIHTYLLARSADLEARKGRKHVQSYLDRTIRNAHRAINH